MVAPSQGFCGFHVRAYKPYRAFSSLPDKVPCCSCLLGLQPPALSDPLLLVPAGLSAPSPDKVLCCSCLQAYVSEAGRRSARFDVHSIVPVVWSMTVLGDSVRACQPASLRAVLGAAERLSR